MLGTLVLAACACGSVDPPDSPVRRAPAFVPREPGVIRLGGTGAMTPLAYRLAARWREQERRPVIEVEAAVGTGGGIYAAADGAVDLGMTSRDLEPAEAALGLLRVAVAEDAVVIAAHSRVAIDGLTSDELIDLYAGERDRFADGSPAILLLRDAKESANGALEAVVPALRAAREAGYRSRRWRVLYHDDAMGEALAATEGGLGVFSLGAIAGQRLPLKVLALDGVTPSMASLAQGRWKARRQLAFVFRPERRDYVADFLAFVDSGAGQEVIASASYLPLVSR